MIVNEETHTTPRQRIVICLIAFLLLASTFALYAGIVLSADNKSNGKFDINDPLSRLSETERARFEELSQQVEAARQAQAQEYSERYFDEFAQHRSRIKAFNAADVTTVTTTDLKVGDGTVVDSADFDNYSAYYVGWLPDEKIFDSSFDNPQNPTALRAPLPGSTSMIQGWLDGIQGMKLGGIREISIPSALAYGAEGQGMIPANSPLKFIVMLIEKPEAVAEPQEYRELLAKIYGIPLEALEKPADENDAPAEEK